MNAATAGVGAAAAGAAAVAGYWLTMSSQSQALGPFPNRGAPTGAVDSRPRIALTFDDGPNEPYTSALADLLADRAVRATFFQVGRALTAQHRVKARPPAVDSTA